ncbi:MAG: response regulator transcription factor [Actinomycetota bacterium]
MVRGPNLRVVLADDDVLVLAGMEALLDTVEGLTVVGQAGSLEELLDLVESVEPDVVVTDIRMPPTGVDEGVEAAQRLRDTHPEIGVVVLSQYVDPQLAYAVLDDGSRHRGYLLKEHVSDVDQLVEAIRTVAAAGSWIDTVVLDALVAARTGGVGAELRRLTARELDVLADMARGSSNAAIAQHLYIGERAVEKNVRSIFSKLGLTNDGRTNRRVQATLLYLAASNETGVGDGG